MATIVKLTLPLSLDKGPMRSIYHLTNDHRLDTVFSSWEGCLWIWEKRWHSSYLRTNWIASFLRWTNNIPTLMLLVPTHIFSCGCPKSPHEFCEEWKKLLPLQYIKGEERKTSFIEHIVQEFKMCRPSSKLVGFFFVVRQNLVFEISHNGLHPCAGSFYPLHFSSHSNREFCYMLDWYNS